MQQGNVESQPLTQIERGGVQLHPACHRPKVELIPRSAAVETTENMLAEMHGKTPALWRRRTVDGARSPPLISPPLGRFEADQIENLRKSHQAAKCWKVHARHGNIQQKRDQRRGTRSASEKNKR